MDLLPSALAVLKGQMSFSLLCAKKEEKGIEIRGESVRERRIEKKGGGGRECTRASERECMSGSISEGN